MSCGHLRGEQGVFPFCFGLGYVILPSFVDVTGSPGGRMRCLNGNGNGTEVGTGRRAATEEANYETKVTRTKFG